MVVNPASTIPPFHLESHLFLSTTSPPNSDLFLLQRRRCLVPPTSVDSFPYGDASTPATCLIFFHAHSFCLDSMDAFVPSLKKYHPRHRTTIHIPPSFSNRNPRCLCSSIADLGSINGIY